MTTATMTDQVFERQQGSGSGLCEALTVTIANLHNLIGDSVDLDYARSIRVNHAEAETALEAYGIDLYYIDPDLYFWKDDPDYHRDRYAMAYNIFISACYQLQRRIDTNGMINRKAGKDTNAFHALITGVTTGENNQIRRWLDLGNFKKHVDRYFEDQFEKNTYLTKTDKALYIHAEFKKYRGLELMYSDAGIDFASLFFSMCLDRVTTGYAHYYTRRDGNKQSRSVVTAICASLRNEGVERHFRQASLDQPAGENRTLLDQVIDEDQTIQANYTIDRNHVIDSDNMISLRNDLINICADLGIDFIALIKAINADPDLFKLISQTIKKYTEKPAREKLTDKDRAELANKWIGRDKAIYTIDGIAVTGREYSNNYYHQVLKRSPIEDTPAIDRRLVSKIKRQKRIDITSDQIKRKDKLIDLPFDDDDDRSYAFNQVLTAIRNDFRLIQAYIIDARKKRQILPKKTYKRFFINEFLPAIRSIRASTKERRSFLTTI